MSKQRTSFASVFSPMVLAARAHFRLGMCSLSIQQQVFFSSPLAPYSANASVSPLRSRRELSLAGESTHEGLGLVLTQTQWSPWFTLVDKF
eukprot:3614674-Amphidinium_carterae.2